MPSSLPRSLFRLSSSLALFALKFPHSESQLPQTSVNPPLPRQTAMAINLQAHAFAGNPLRTKNPKPESANSINSAVDTLKNIIMETTIEGSVPNLKILLLQNGRPLACSLACDPGDAKATWHLGWIGIADCKQILAKSGMTLTESSLVYLGSEEAAVYWAIDVTDILSDSSIELGQSRFAFIELRTLMVATDWADSSSMEELSIAGHARALLEWRNTSRFCGYCGARTLTIDAGKRKQCLNESCKKRIYPRIDPVVIMLVIDKENDCVLLSRQSRYVPRMWSCLAGFIEPGESLEEAVRRETFEETGIEVDEVVYHSSQPWPVGPNSMPCQLMVGFFAYAKSFEIHVDKAELEDARWHSREDVKNALACAEYEKAQMTAANKVIHMCRGVEKGQNFTKDFSLESGELATMFIPGPFAIAHHLISSWAYQIAPSCA